MTRATTDPRAEAIAWHHAQQAVMAGSIEPWAHGNVLRTPLAPDYWDVNTVRMEGSDPGLEAAELIELVDVLQANLRHRRLEVEDEGAGARLRAAFLAAGWTPERLVSMYRTGVPPEWPADVEEVPFPATRPLRLEWHQSEDWGDSGTLHMDSQEAVAARNGTRAFVVRAGGEAVGFSALFSPAGFTAGEVEQAYVTPAHRGRGLGGRLVAGALAAGGHDANWIEADEDDRPKRLYARMGFQPVWLRYQFTRTPGSR
jgi:GNAT superfamily N-acetyltransferase